MYRYKSNTADIKFSEFDNVLDIIDKIQNGKTNLSNVENNQQKLKYYLGEEKKMKPKNIDQKCKKNTLYNSEMLYKARNKAIKFFDDHFSMMSDAKHRATKGTGLEILTSKQMLQRLPIALAQVKAGNNSESLLNEIKKIVYSLYQSKHITKKSIQ